MYVYFTSFQKKLYKKNILIYIFFYILIKLFKIILFNISYSLLVFIYIYFTKINNKFNY